MSNVNWNWYQVVNTTNVSDDQTEAALNAIMDVLGYAVWAGQYYYELDLAFITFPCMLAFSLWYLIKPSDFVLPKKDEYSVPHNFSFDDFQLYKNLRLNFKQILAIHYFTAWEGVNTGVADDQIDIEKYFYMYLRGFLDLILIQTCLVTCTLGFFYHVFFIFFYGSVLVIVEWLKIATPGKSDFEGLVLDIITEISMSKVALKNGITYDPNVG